MVKGGAEGLREGDPELRCEGRATVGGDLFWHIKATNPSGKPLHTMKKTLPTSGLP